MYAGSQFQRQSKPSMPYPRVLVCFVDATLGKQLGADATVDYSEPLRAP